MIIDAHLHCTGRERADEVLRAFDGASIEATAQLLVRLAGSRGGERRLCALPAAGKAAPAAANSSAPDLLQAPVGGDKGAR